MELHSHLFQGREKGRVNSYLFLLDEAIFTQVCGTQETSALKKKKL